MKLPTRTKLLLLVGLLAIRPTLAPVASAQISVGGNGSNTTDSTAYSGSQTLTKVGSNTVTLTGDSSYTGITTINAGTLVLDEAAGAQLYKTGGLFALGDAVTVNTGGTFQTWNWNYGANNALSQLMANHSAIVVNGGRVVFDDTFTADRAFTVGANGATLETTAGNTYTKLANPIFTIWFSANSTLTVGGAGNTVINDALGSVGNTGFSIAKTGAGTLTLGGNNTHTGATTISAGTLQVGNGGTSGTLGSGSVTNNGSLVFDRSNAMTVSNAISGNGSVTKNGAGTLTISGSNTNTGGTTINAGTLSLASSNLLADSGAVTINSGGTFNLGSNGDYIGSLTMNGNATVSGTSGLGGGQIILTTGQPSDSKIKTLTVTGTNNQIQTNIGLSSQWAGVGDNANLNFNVTGVSDTLQVGGVIADTAFDGGGNATVGAITKSGLGTLILSGNNTYTGGTTISGGTLRLASANRLADSGAVTVSGGSLDLGGFSDTVGVVALTSGAIANGTLTGSAYNLQAGTVSAVLAGSGALTKNGSGTVTLGGNNTYSGGTTVSGGKLAGTTTSLKGAITNNAQVEFAQDGDGSYSGNMGGSGALIKSGAGAVTLSGSNTHSGGTTISGGKLIASTANLQGNIANNAEFELAQNTAGTYAGNISGTGSLTKSGSGTVTLGGSNTYSGGTAVSAGRLVGTTSSLQGAISNNAAVEFAQSSTGTYLGSMAGTGSLTKSGAGALTLSGNSTYSGATTVSAGTLNVDGAIASTATVQSGASIGGSGRVGGLILESGATLNPGNSPGTLAVNGNATWNGGANYNWQVYAANTNAAVQTGAGTGWDFFDVTGTLTLGLDPSNRFNLNLWSLSGTTPDVNGQIPGWDPTVGSTWLIASAAGGINLGGSALLTNTDYSSFFNINTAAINGTGGWIGSLPESFQVLTLGNTNNLYLYAAPGSAAVPEPGQVAASLLLLAGIGGYVWLKRRRAAKSASA